MIEQIPDSKQSISWSTLAKFGYPSFLCLNRWRGFLYIVFWKLKKKSYISNRVHIYKSKLILFFLFMFSNFLLSLDLSWKSHIFYHSLSFFRPLYISPPKNTSSSFQKTRSYFEKHFLPSFFQHIDSLSKPSPSLFSHNLLSPLENQPCSLLKKVFLYFFNPKPNHHLERCWCFAKNNVIFLTKTSLILHMVYSNPSFYQPPSFLF